MILTWASVDGSDTIVARAQDPDGEGPLDLEIQDNIDLIEDTEYNLSVQLRNSIEDEDITQEIMEEDDDHMFFFSFTDGTFSNPEGDGNIDDRGDSINYNDVDENGLPVGLSTNWTTSSEMNGGTFRIVLKHQPDIKSATSTADDGSTDIDLTFDLNSLTSTNDRLAELQRQLTLAPNPTTSQLSWNLQGQGFDDDLEVRILSMTGRLIQFHRSPSTQLDVSQVPVGTYIFQLQTSEARISKRFVKVQ